MAKEQLVNIGFANFIFNNRIIAIVGHGSSPMRRLREDAKQEGRLIDATQGRKTRSIVITDSNHTILSSVQPETMRQRIPLISIGFANFIFAQHVVAIMVPGSSPMRRLREEATKESRLIDATQGRKTRSIIITDSNHVILSAIQAETMRQRFQEEEE